MKILSLTANAGGLPVRAWVGVASAEHAAYGASRGWIQLNHGKRDNLARLKRGDGFVYYSPTQRFGDTTPFRAVTQLGTVVDDEPYLANEPMDMGAMGTFRPWRRNVDFLEVNPVAINSLSLHLTQNRDWGHYLRYGLVPLSVDDFLVLHRAMVKDLVDEKEA